MVVYAYNSTSSVNVAHFSSTSSTLPVQHAVTATDPLVAVIVILSVVVAAAILFVICGLFLKAEAHLRSGDIETTMEGLLVEPTPMTLE